MTEIIKTSSIVGIGAILLGMGLVSFNMQPVTGASPASITSMDGFVQGSITCPPSTVKNNVNLNLRAGQVGSLFSLSFQGGNIVGVHSLGEFDKNSFTMRSIIEDSGCFAGTPTVAIVSGTCGIGTTVTLTTDTGITGTLVGNVACI